MKPPRICVCALEVKGLVKEGIKRGLPFARHCRGLLERRSGGLVEDGICFFLGFFDFFVDILSNL
jgi:hypothetical protein